MQRMVAKILLPIAAALVFSAAAPAQHGTAPSGYYPFGYVGDTWTGTVTSTNDETREITLTYTRGDKTDTFTGALKAGLAAKRKDGSHTGIKPSEIPVGTRLIVCYMPQTKKMQGQKVKTYEIFQYALAPTDQR